MGISEISEFEQGTNKMIDYLASVTSAHVLTIAAGGDTVT